MAYIDRNILSDYPFKGRFYRIAIDESKPLDEQVEEEVTVLETECDVTESSHSWSNNFIWAKYAVYFPLKINEEIEGENIESQVKVKMGDLFEADVYGMRVNGKVVGVFPSQLGGVTCYVQDTDV